MRSSLLFDGKYHGEGDATLVSRRTGGSFPRAAACPGVAAQARIVQFNDVGALEAALAPGDVALVLAEPAMTNAGFLLPAAGLHDALRQATRDAGTLLAIDETHSLVCSYAGLAREWGLEPDLLTLGKSIAAGVPLATYGMREEIAALIAPPEEARVVSGAFVDEVATGGTLFGNALSMAAGRAALVEVLTEEAFGHPAALGERMAAGLRAAIERAGLSWSVVQSRLPRLLLLRRRAARRRRRLPGGRRPRPAGSDPRLHGQPRSLGIRLVAGPTVSVAHEAEDVDLYLAVFEEFLSELTLRAAVPPERELTR